MNPAARVALVPEHWARARTASAALFRCGFAPVVTGGLAAWAWGHSRSPADVDLEVTTRELVYSARTAGFEGDQGIAELTDALLRAAGIGNRESDGPRVDVVPAPRGTECPHDAWTWVGGLPIAAPWYLTTRALLRIAADAKGPDALGDVVFRRGVALRDLDTARGLARMFPDMEVHPAVKHALPVVRSRAADLDAVRSAVGGVPAPLLRWVAGFTR